MPGPSIPSNLPAEALRWTLLRAAKEIGFISAPTLASRLRDSGEQPDAGDCWSTSQVLGAAYGGDLHSQRVREVAERADAWALKNAVMRGEYINRLELEQMFAGIAASIKTVIRSSTLTREEQDDVLRSMSGIKVRVAGIAAAQRRGINGDGRDNGDGSKQPARRKRGRPRKVVEAQPAAVQQQ